MKLYHFPVSPNSRRVLAVIYHLGLDCELETVDLSSGQQMKPEFLQLNPNHMIPTLVDGDFVLWESNAIMQYLCSKKPGSTLWPADAKAQADISRWQCWGLAHFGSACGIYIYEHLVKRFLNLGCPDPAELKKAEERFHRFASVLDNHLMGRTWLAGKSTTLADYSVGAPLALAEAAAYPMAPHTEIRRWYAGIEALEPWKRSAPPA
ncbi:MAG: glutathione S-transferase family protein [Gammaproteobacteria bacterium]